MLSKKAIAACCVDFPGRKPNWDDVAVFSFPGEMTVVYVQIFRELWIKFRENRDWSAVTEHVS